MREPALAIVRQDHHVEIRQHTLVIGELRFENLMRRNSFEIDTQQLLLAADDAQLHGGGYRPVAMERRAHAVAGEQLVQDTPRFVLSHDADERCLCAQRRGIAGYIARTARPLFAARDFHDRDRRFR